MNSSLAQSAAELWLTKFALKEQIVAIGNPERHMHKASHRGSKQQWSSHAMITLLLLVRATYMYGVVLHAHPVRGESNNQRNTTGEVATKSYFLCNFYIFVENCFLSHNLALIMLESQSWAPKTRIFALFPKKRELQNVLLGWRPGPGKLGQKCENNSNL